MRSKHRILCIDIEGGYGGSSRSLFKSLKFIDRSKVDVEVWCKRKGPIQLLYEEIGIPTRVTPDMPKITAVRRLSRNIAGFLIFMRDWYRGAHFRKRLQREVPGQFDLIHLNHESLFWLGRWLRKRIDVPVTMHIRTNLPNNEVARFQEKTIHQHMNHLVFITENERTQFEQLSGAPSTGTVIHNIAETTDFSEKIPDLENEKRFKVASLSGFDPLRGVDRLTDVARQLKRQGRNNIVFVVAGNMSVPRSMGGELRSYGRRGLSYPDFIEDSGLSDFFIFLGHVSEPEKVLSSSNCLIKLTREDNPWGRDIIESMAMGKPVISIGKYGKFVQTNETGLLYETYDVDSIARGISELADNGPRCDRLGEQAKRRISSLCNGDRQAAKLLEVWEIEIQK